MREWSHPSIGSSHLSASQCQLCTPQQCLVGYTAGSTAHELGEDGRRMYIVIVAGDQRLSAQQMIDAREEFPNQNICSEYLGDILKLFLSSQCVRCMVMICVLISVDGAGKSTTNRCGSVVGTALFWKVRHFHSGPLTALDLLGSFAIARGVIGSNRRTCAHRWWNSTQMGADDVQRHDCCTLEEEQHAIELL